jgi:hypothetical protein
MPIQNSAVLTELNISVWTANKLDRDAGREVTISAGASNDAGFFRKNLMAGTTKRKAIADFAAQCRLWHNQRTMPWSDRGSRILPTSMFLDYKREANDRQNHFNGMVDDFVRDYPELVKLSATYLGTMFDASEYPYPDQVRSKFGMRLVFSPLPESGDFRINVGQEDMAELREQYDEAFNVRLQEAMREPWDRVTEMVKSMAAKLDDDKHQGKTRRWHDTFITNAEEMCDLLKHMNVTGDADLSSVERRLRNAIRGVDVDSLKDDAFARDEVKQELDKIMKDFEW